MKIVITEHQFNIISEQEKPDYLIDRQSNAILNAVGIRPDKQYKLVDSMINDARNLKKSNQPLHYKMAIKFLLMDKSPLTTEDLSSKNIDTLQDVLCNKSKLQKTCDTNKWIGQNREKIPNKNQLLYEDFTVNYPKSPSYKKTSYTYTDQPMGVQELMLTIGNSTVRSSGSNWVITDEYDFKNIGEQKKYLKTNSLFGIIKNEFKGLWKVFKSLVRLRTPAEGFEEMLSQHHNMGYNGFKTRLVIPVGNCPCKTK